MRYIGTELTGYSLSGGIIKISEDELKKLNKTSIPLQDGSGYIAYLEAIHMLHCVVRRLVFF